MKIKLVEEGRLRGLDFASHGILQFAGWRPRISASALLHKTQYTTLFTEAIAAASGKTDFQKADKLWADPSERRDQDGLLSSHCPTFSCSNKTSIACCHYMMAPGYLGLGEHAEAHMQFDQVLAMDANHVGAAIHRAIY